MAASKVELSAAAVVAPRKIVSTSGSVFISGSLTLFGTRPPQTVSVWPAKSAVAGVTFLAEKAREARLGPVARGRKIAA
jgi:hypothetical protein